MKFPPGTVDQTPLVGPNTANVITTDTRGHLRNASVLISSFLEEHRNISDDGGADGPVSEREDAVLLRLVANDGCNFQTHAHVNQNDTISFFMTKQSKRF